MSSVRYSRQHAIWGKAGQEVLEDSTLTIVGADKLGMEIAKSASILGVGNLYLIDNVMGRDNSTFLDMSFHRNAPKVKSLEEMIQIGLNRNCKVRGLDSKVSKTLLSLLQNQTAVIDVSNNPQSQYVCLDYCKRQNIPFLSAVASRTESYFSLYDPSNEGDFRIIIPDFESNSQGIILSNILAGIMVEEYRKLLFKKNNTKFRNQRILEPNGNIVSLEKKIMKEKVMVKDLYYNINSNDRFGCNSFHLGVNTSFSGKRILVLGCGALGNYLVDMATRLFPKRLDVVDFDVFEDHNLNRQPLGYNGVGNYKAKVLRDKINSISSERVSSKALVGYVGKDKDAYLQKKVKDMNQKFPSLKLSMKDIELLNKAWFSKYSYDLVFGAFDNLDVRSLMNDFSTEIKFNYIDCGSSTKGGRANIYVPNHTNCIGCSLNLDSMQRIVRKDPNEVIQELRDRGEFDSVANVVSCAYVDGSVNMSNQTAAGLGMAEARLVLGKLYSSLMDRVSYESHSVNQLQSAKLNEVCKCG
jgi:molybdopterin/thiamine biosynthesis adenylyltransferase